MTKCNVRFNKDNTKWYCLDHDGNPCPSENLFCNLKICKGRKLTEEEDNERLLQIESKIPPPASPRKQVDSLDSLIRRMKKELERIEEEEKKFSKKCEYKIDGNGKWFCKKNMDSSLPMDEKECYRDECPGRKLTYEEEIEDNLVVINVKKELKALQKQKALEQVEPALPIIKPIEPIKEIPKEETRPTMQKCEWHICTNTFEIGGKKEKFCSSKCQKKDSRLRWRRRSALRDKGISPKTS